MAVKDNIIFDPSKEELAVAEVVLAVSIGELSQAGGEGAMEVDSGKGTRDLRLLAIRTIDPPSRLTHSGVPNALNTATGGSAPSRRQIGGLRPVLISVLVGELRGVQDGW